MEVALVFCLSSARERRHRRAFRQRVRRLVGPRKNAHKETSVERVGAGRRGRRPFRIFVAGEVHAIGADSENAEHVVARSEARDVHRSSRNPLERFETGEACFEAAVFSLAEQIGRPRETRTEFATRRIAGVEAAGKSGGDAPADLKTVVPSIVDISEFAAWQIDVRKIELAIAEELPTEPYAGKRSVMFTKGGSRARGDETAQRSFEPAGASAECEMGVAVESEDAVAPVLRRMATE